MEKNGRIVYNTAGSDRGSGKGKMDMIKRFGTAVMLALVLAIFLQSAALAEKTILMTFTGDCTLGSEETKRGNPSSFDSFANKKGYDYFFANFREMFSNDDLTVVNLEGVLSDSPYNENKKKAFRFRGPADFAKILTGSSIEACTLANNHTMDFGTPGMKNTQAALDAQGVAWFIGEKFYLHQHDGLTIAFVGLDSTRYNKMRNRLGEVFRNLKENQGANAVVVCIHAGQEYRPKHEDSIATIANKLVDSGADLVIMHHPHVLQGIEVINGRHVFYSVGNFVFGGNCEIKKNKKNSEITSLYTMVVQVRMTFTNEGKYLGQQAVIYPAHISDDPEANHYQPLRLRAADAGPVVEAIQRDTAFELPAVTEKDGLSLIELPYVPDSEETMMPEE